MRKLILTALLATGMNVQAEDGINYNFLELGYGTLDLYGTGSADGVYLDGAFDLSDRFYLGGFYDNKSRLYSDLDRYGLSLGFHTSISGKTDFYSQVELGRFESRFFHSTTSGLNFGTRTAFNSRFELISKLGYTHLDKSRNGYIEAELKGLFKFSENHAITASIESLDGDKGANLGFRYTF